MDIEKQFKKWRKEQDAIILAAQRKCENLPDHIRKSNTPYYGAIGGAWSTVTVMDKDGNLRTYTKHVTGNTFEWPPEPLDSYTQSYLDKIYVKGHEYEISSCGTSIGLLVRIKDLTTGEQITNSDDI